MVVCQSASCGSETLLHKWNWRTERKIKKDKVEIDGRFWLSLIENIKTAILINTLNGRLTNEWQKKDCRG